MHTLICCFLSWQACRSCRSDYAVRKFKTQMHFSLCINVYLSLASSIIDYWSSFAVLICIQLPSCNSALVPFLQVTLLIPWLNQEDQALVFHGKHMFDQPEQQTECIQDWIRKRTGFEAQFKIRYYPGRYDTRLLGIFPVGDLTVYIPVEEVSHVKRRAHANCDSLCSIHTVLTGPIKPENLASSSLYLTCCWQEFVTNLHLCY